MISWLKGEIIQNWKLSSKEGIVLNVDGVGYEIQILSKQIEINNNSKEIEFWVHQINREECTNLYGFIEINQRNLFRKIISVNGIGPQIGMSLLQDFEVDQIVEAIEESDVILLTKSQGIGKRIAERLIVELKNKLQSFKDDKENSSSNKSNKTYNQFGKYLEEIKSILNSLGYEDNEIKDSLELIITNEKENTILMKSLSAEAKTELMDNHLKEILIRLSQKST
tara:strand:+ start:109 stop:783 length:675 start_codon:yes stop_codon:yes gene_type:complete